MDPDTSTDGGETADNNAAIDDGAPFDVEAMIRESLFPAETPARDAKGSAKPKAAGKAAQAESDPEETTEGEPETEDGEESKEASDDEDADEDEGHAQDLLKNPEALLKAHEEIKAKARERKDRIAELEAKLADRSAEGAAVVLEATRANPLANVATTEDLADAEKYWKGELAWCRKNRDGGERTVGKEEQEWSAEQVAAREDLALDVLGEHIARRREFIGENRQSISAALEKFPFLAANHALHKEADGYVTALMKRVPELCQHPKWPEIVSTLFAGKLAIEGKHAVTGGKDGKVHIVSLGTDKAKAKTVTKSPPVRGAGSTPPARRAENNATDDAIAAAYAAGDIEEASRLAISTRLNKAA